MVDGTRADTGEGGEARWGSSYRTLAVVTVESGRLTGRMSDALERRTRVLGGGSAAARQQERVEALEQRVEALEEDMEPTRRKEMRAGLEAADGRGLRALREELAQGMRRLERRLAHAEADRGSTRARRRKRPP